jgi:hypothetical protein
MYAWRCKHLLVGAHGHETRGRLLLGLVLPMCLEQCMIRHLVKHCLRLVKGINVTMIEQSVVWCLISFLNLLVNKLLPIFLEFALV